MMHRSCFHERPRVQAEFNNPLNQVDAYFVSGGGGDGVNPQALAQREELKMYIDNKKSDEKVSSFVQQTRERARNKGTYINDAKMLKEEESRKKKELITRKRDFIKSHQYTNQNAGRASAGKVSEKVIVISYQQEKEKEKEKEKELEKEKEKEKVKVKEKSEAIERRPMRTHNSKIENNRKDNVSIEKTNPLNSNEIHVPIDNRYDIIYTDNKNVVHANERYKDIRYKLKR